tara:strand:- start:141 stop:911 length:771 start_codon:yes stop_codon:yes gene_type:complete
MSVVDSVFRRAGIVPTGAPKTRRARRAPQVVAGVVVEDVEVVPPGDDAESLINGLEDQLRKKDEWIAQFRQELMAAMMADKTALARKDAELRRCQAEVEDLKRLRSSTATTLWELLRKREIAQGIRPDMAFTEAMGRELEGGMQAEKAARIAKEDAKAQAWMNAAQRAASAAANATPTFGPNRFAARPSPEPGDDSPYAARGPAPEPMDESADESADEDAGVDPDFAPPLVLQPMAKPKRGRSTSRTGPTARTRTP